MDEQKTLLEQIREKESELGKRQEGAVKKTDEILAAAKLDVEKILAEADARGRAMAEEYRHKAGERIAAEVAEIQARGAQEALALRGSAEKNLPRAVDRIVEAVTYK